VRLGDLLELVQYGTSKRCTDEPVDGDLPVLRIPNIVSGRLDISDLKWASFTNSEYELYRIRVGDVLVVRTNGNPEYVGRGVVLGADAPPDAVFASYLIRLRPRRELLEPDFLAALLDAPAFRAALRGSIRSSAGNYNLNATNIRAQGVRVPTLDVQRVILSQLDAVAATNEMVDRLVADIDSAEKKLMQTLLGEA
jgi:restriction endonuclease S subunit